MKATMWGCLVWAATLGYGAEQDAAMSDAYWKIWNPEVQARIDRDIAQHRQADGSFAVAGLTGGTEVQVEQLTHDFFFGANIFNFDQLGTSEYNRKYKQLFGTLFNSATIPFYWKKFEMEPDHPRFRAEERDSEEYWNAAAEPKREPHWRRPATDPIVAFCASQGIRLHGHPDCLGEPHVASSRVAVRPVLPGGRERGDSAAGQGGARQVDARGNCRTGAGVHPRAAATVPQTRG